MIEPNSERAEFRIMIAIAIAFIVLIPSLILGGFLWREVGVRTDDNRELIEAQANLLKQIQRNERAQTKLRAQARVAIRQADIANCREDEIVKDRLRQIVMFRPEEVANTLEQLGIDPASPQGQNLTVRAKANADEAVRALRKRDCSKLPNPSKPFDG